MGALTQTISLLHASGTLSAPQPVQAVCRALTIYAVRYGYMLLCLTLCSTYAQHSVPCVIES